MYALQLSYIFGLNFIEISKTSIQKISFLFNIMIEILKCTY